MKKEYRIKVKKATTMNAQANLVIEQIHQVIRNMVHTFKLEEIYLGNGDL